MKLLKLNLYHQLFQFILVMKLEIESPEGFTMVVQGYNQPHKCCITSFPQLKWVSQSGQDTFYIFDLPCLLKKKTKKNVFNWTQAKVFLTVTWSHSQPSFLFFLCCECVRKLSRLEIGQWSVFHIHALQR